ncbi:MAG: hypothetical protein CMB80_08040 [Flammeovirgaceae bacterium]|nr:hypothetical protein [Flammeovirgaceae bacterium]
MSKNWAKTNMRINIRSDGRREWICKHGIGHTVGVPEEKKGDTDWWLHGCDGCCKKYLEEE